ncbi:hypothetical protein [Micromonospora sp. NBC_00858]|uniref:hypothetical protein n=1 Tax=Micromonospora sp. NBC_00858 TaxID=2975979 RepID=UPI0038668D9B|nr:hypothetical protein OG990_04395 [Micromonospora sp. NBC_00858]
MNSVVLQNRGPLPEIAICFRGSAFIVERYAPAEICVCRLARLENVLPNVRSSLPGGQRLAGKGSIQVDSGPNPLLLRRYGPVVKVFSCRLKLVLFIGRYASLKRIRSKVFGVLSGELI